MNKVIKKRILTMFVFGFLMSPLVAMAAPIFGIPTPRPGTNLLPPQGAQGAFTIDFNDLQNHAAELCLGHVPNGVDGECRDSGVTCEVNWMQCAIHNSATQCQMNPNDPGQQICLQDPRLICDLKARTDLQTVRQTCSQTPSNGLIPIDPAHRQDFFNNLDNKCALLIKGGDACADANGTCRNAYAFCAQADPFGCVQQDEAGLVACKVDPTTIVNACDDEVQAKLTTLVPKECLRLVNNQQENPPSQAPSESPVRNAKGVIAGGGCSLSPSGTGTSIGASLVFFLTLIPMILRMRKEKKI